MTTRCALDGAPTPDWTICRPCAADLERALAETPALVEELDLTLTRQTGTGHGVGARSSEHPVVFDPRASAVLGDLRAVLVGWVRDLEPDPTYHPADTVGAMARWMLGRRGQVVVHPAAGDIVTELLEVTRRGWRLIDLAPRTRVNLHDPCPDCGAGLRATMHDVDDPRPNLVWCLGEARHRWEPMQWVRLGQRLGYGREAAG